MDDIDEPSAEEKAEEKKGEGKRDERPPLPAADLWLVDGFNVLHAVLLGGEKRGRFWDREQRQRLIERLASIPTPTPCPRIVLVFDGKRAVEGAEAHPAPHLELVFAPSADNWIVKRARREAREAESAAEAAAESSARPGAESSADPRAKTQAESSADLGAKTQAESRRVGVVTNDRQVVGRCRHAGAEIVAPADFMAHFPDADADSSAETGGGHAPGDDAS